MKIRAALLREMELPRPYAESRPLKIEEVELDPPGEGELLVEIKAVGLCHSDLSTINGSRPRPMPMVLGHEAAGIVTEVGPAVHDIAVGDHVVMVFVPSCGRCTFCMAGRPALCAPGGAANGAGTLISGARRLHQGASPINHHLGVSAFAEYAVVSRNSVVKIDPALAFEEAALFGCAVLTGVGAAVNTAEVRPGASVAVIGLGGVGLCALLGARLAGAGRVIAIDVRNDKLAFAKQLGATDTFNAGDAGCAEQVRAATGGGAEYVVETAGAVPALELAFKITARGGVTVTAGLPHPKEMLPVHPVTLVAEERTLKGSYVGSCVPVRDVPAYMALYREGRLPVDRLMSERVTLDELNEAFDRLAEGATVRQVLVL